MPTSDRVCAVYFGLGASYLSWNVAVVSILKDGPDMVKGIGIDTVDIEEMRRLCSDMDGAFVRRTFTEAECAQAALRHDMAQVLAGKFAVKEAAFKALAGLTTEGFDLRIVETLEDVSGAPHITLAGPLASVLAEADVTELLVSITNERDLATAIVLAQ